MDNESEDENRAIANHALYIATLRGMDGMRLLDVAMVLAKLAGTLQCRRIVEAVQCFESGSKCDVCRHWLAAANLSVLTNVTSSGAQIVQLDQAEAKA